MLYAQVLLDKLQEEKLKKAEQAKIEYEKELKSLRKVKSFDRPPKPAFSVVHIPGNISASKLTQHLADNAKENCPAIMVEAEIDTVANIQKHDWGNFSDVVRRSFHNEPIRMSRRMDNEYLEAKVPKLSMALSGTPNQVKNLIGTAEDGMYSRWLVYSCGGSSEWIDVSPGENNTNLTAFFDQQAEEFKKFYEYLLQHPFKMQLTKEQWAKVNGFGGEKLEQFKQYGNEYVISLGIRHAVMIFKMAMVLTAFRHFEEEGKEDVRTCADGDFDYAVSLADKSLKNALELFEKLPEGDLSAPENKKAELYSSLPDSFTTKEALTVGKALLIPSRSAERCLKEGVEAGKLIRLEHGKYQKVKVA
jgi:hypothetical protein